MASATTEVHAFLASIGLEACAHAVVHNGFYTSMDALKGATIEELVDSGVRPAHAKLILSNLSASATPFDADLNDAPTSEVASFLRSVGLENCNNALAEAGYSTLDALGRATIQDLVSAGLKPVHARLIVSNLDTASSSGINMTPAAERAIDLDDVALLGGTRAKPRPIRLYLFIGIIIIGAAAFYVSHGGKKDINRMSGLPTKGNIAGGAGALGGEHPKRFGKKKMSTSPLKPPTP